MFYRNISFRVKIFIIIFIAILLPVILVSSILFKRSEQAITDQTSKVVISSLDFAIQNIDYSLDAAVGMSELILTDSGFISTADSGRIFDDEEKTRKYSGVRELLNFILARIKSLNILAGIDSFYVYLVNQDAIIDSKTTYYENVNEDNVDFLQKLKSDEYNEAWFVSEPVDYYTINRIESRLADSKHLITYNKVLKGKSGNTLAVLAVNIDENFLSDYYKRIQTGISGEFVVIDRNENIAAHANKSVIGKKFDKYSELNSRITNSKYQSGSFFLKIDNEEKFVVYSISKYSTWRYIVIIPASDILGKVYEIRSFLFVIISITILLVFGITLLLSFTFYKPLEKLVSAMQKIESRNLNVKIDDKRRDEYQKVYKGFNDMVSELKSLINDLTNEKILKKEAEIKLLQAQINPHFLYNTLESIHSIAKIKNVEEISLMVSALSKFFRISLSGGKDIVTLSEAIDLAVSYLTIQNIRFKGKISYDVNVTEELKGYKVPKLILQPIVENSIYHGIERRKGEGKLVITGEMEDGVLKLVVEDNGIGIDKDNLQELRESIESESFEDSRNFALRNLNRQIKLKYGPGYGIYIESESGIGTRVSVRLPIM